jgi:regulation of enolase protein 1 (concanavalin A-like superfamily)
VKPNILLILLGMAWASAKGAETLTVTDDFKEALGPGWSIIREQSDAWRATSRGLEVRVLPGNIWGPANDAKNVFVRDALDPAKGPVTVSARVQNRPTHQYEQVDLVWYYNDGRQVKIGQELVDGKLSLVMGREEEDRARTIAILPLQGDTVDLKFEVEGNLLRGFYREAGEGNPWKEAGSCDLPALGAPRIALQVYQGPPDVERWAVISQFKMEQTRR